MLWTDSLWLTSADLLTIDSEVQDVATAENITLDGMTGKIWRTMEHASSYMLSRMVTFAGFMAGDSLSANHLQAVMNIGTPAVQRTMVLLDNICVNGQNPNLWSEIKNWVAYLALTDIYKSASNLANQEMDRYDRKMKSFQEEAKYDRWNRVVRLGAPVVYKPMAVPGAVMAHNPGTYSIGLVGGSGSVTGNYLVAISYIDTTVTTVPPNNESDLSAAVSVALTNGNNIHVDITGLNPPTGIGSPLDVARSIITPLNATAYNIYVGQNATSMYLQNPSPIPIATKTYTLPNPTTSGPLAYMGQFVNQYLTIQERVTRG